MTRDKKAKKIARAWKDVQSTSYTSARRATPPPSGGNPPPPIDYDDEDLTPPGDDDAGYSTPSVEKLVKPLLQRLCDDLADEPINSLQDVQPAELAGLSDTAVGELKVDLDTVDANVIERYEGGTMVCSVFAEASLTVEGLMTESAAATAAENGVVEILEHHIDRGHALVAITVPQAVQVEFDATVTPDAGSVDDLNFVRAFELSNHPPFD
jgi:hypothetical protein